MMECLSFRSRGRIFLCGIFVVLSLLVVGASHVTRELKAHRRSRNVEKMNWAEVSADMVQYIPLEHRQSWLNAVTANPKLFLKINTAEFAVLEKLPDHITR